MTHTVHSMQRKSWEVDVPMAENVQWCEQSGSQNHPSIKNWQFSNNSCTAIQRLCRNFSTFNHEYFRQWARIKHKNWPPENRLTSWPLFLLQHPLDTDFLCEVWECSKSLYPPFIGSRSFYKFISPVQIEIKQSKLRFSGYSVGYFQWDISSGIFSGLWVFIFKKFAQFEIGVAQNISESIQNCWDDKN